MLAGALISSSYCCRLSFGVLVGAVALDVLGLTALVSRGGVFQISCEGGQLGPLTPQLCAGCGGGYVWTILRTRWCVRVPHANMQYALAAWAWPRAQCVVLCGRVLYLARRGVRSMLIFKLVHRILRGCAYGIVFGICNAWLCA